jgi:hypothetical protein
VEPIRRDQVVPPYLPHQKWTIADESHMEIFARLARIKLMHNPPGPPKPRKSS